MAKAKAKPAALFLMGPTASGKTDLAIALAQRYPVELISVDSALIYRGMDIGTAKPEPELLAKYPHHLIDIRDPSESYSVAEFVQDARPLMYQAAGAGKIPLLVGGTMLYFKGLLDGLADLPPSDPEARRQILRDAEIHGWPHVHRQLAEVDPVAAIAIHPNHSQRIQRALEVYHIAGAPMSSLQGCWHSDGSALRPVGDAFRVLQLGLVPSDRAWLHQRIERRFRQMLELGLVDEVRSLRARGDLTPDLPSIRAVGYRQMWEYLEGVTGYDEMVEKCVAATRQLAKRQLTWLRKWPGLTILAVGETGKSGDMQSNLLHRALNFVEKAVI